MSTIDPAESRSVKSCGPLPSCQNEARELRGGRDETWAGKAVDIEVSETSLELVDVPVVEIHSTETVLIALRLWEGPQILTELTFTDWKNDDSVVLDVVHTAPAAIKS